MTQPIPIYVISLARAKQRRIRVASEFDRVGLEYAIYEGIDGQLSSQELLAKFDARAWTRNMGGPLSLGHLGCYMSHVQLWRQVATGDDAIALICEDDVVFSSKFPDALVSALSMQSQWDIVRFSCVRAKGKLLQAVSGEFSLNAYWGPFTGNGCYLIKRDVAARLADSFLPIRRAHDHELNRFFFYNIRLMGLEPFTAQPQDDGKSFITGKDMALARKFPFYRRLPHYVQKLMNYGRRIDWLFRRGMIIVPRNLTSFR
jgi:glycosyl transferase family 25